MSCMNVQVKCQDCDILYTVMPTWHTKRGTTMEPRYSGVANCKGCGAKRARLIVSAQHGPPPERRGAV